MDHISDGCLRLLLGENVVFVEPIVDGKLVFTEYRLIFMTIRPNNVWSVPIALLWKAELINSTYLKLTTKLALSVMCVFDDDLACERCLERITLLLDAPGPIENAFCCKFRSALRARIPNHPFLSDTSTLLWNSTGARPESELISREFERMHFEHSWKISEANKEFKICSTYPEYHIVPADIENSDMASMAEFRSHRRFPSVVWRSQTTGAVLLRCAQPCVGLMCYRNKYDERFLASVSKSCQRNPGLKPLSGPTRLLIVDARTYRVAQLRRLLGGGSEYSDYYDQAQVCFMDMPNLHAVRLSFERLTQLYTLDTDVNWYSMLEKTSWLTYIAQLLKSAVDIAFALETDGRPVMVHCTDGWDRTAQLSSLAQLLADPYYRTIEGFVVLVEREWLYFGHKFADRCGQGGCNAYPDERSPIFLQWLDCVHQVRRQFPNHFEYNESFLVKLGLHIYSGMFGTFLCNSEHSRQAIKLSTRTCSLWGLLSPRFNPRVVNPFYIPSEQRLLVPTYRLPGLSLWDNLYRYALIPSFKNVMGIVCLNETSTVVTVQVSPKRFPKNVPTEAADATELSPVSFIQSAEQHTTSDTVLINGQPVGSNVVTEESAAEGTNANPIAERNVHRNFLGDLTNTAALFDPGTSQSTVDDRPPPLDSKQLYLFSSDNDSSLAPKKHADNLSLDSTVAILPLSSVTEDSCDALISSIVCHNSQDRFDQPSRCCSGDEARIMLGRRLNSISSYDSCDWLHQPTVCRSPGAKRLSFSTDDCNDVFLADEEAVYASYHRTKSGCRAHCRSSNDLLERPLESDDLPEMEETGEETVTDSCLVDFSSTHPNRSTSPITIHPNGCLSIPVPGGAKPDKRLNRCRTPPDDRPLGPLSLTESQRNEKCSTPLLAARRKSLENLSRVGTDPDPDDSPGTSDFTMHSLPEGELLITETSFGNDDNNVSVDAGQSGEPVDESFLLPISPCANSSERVCAGREQHQEDLTTWSETYFNTQYLVPNTVSKSVSHSPPTIVEVMDSLRLVGQINQSAKRDQSVQPISAPISPSMMAPPGFVEPSAHLSSVPSTSESCSSPTSVPSQISPASTFQPERDTCALTTEVLTSLPDWDGLPTLFAQVTTSVHAHDAVHNALQQKTIAQLDAELRNVKRELQLQKQETENLRQLCTSLQASRTPSQQMPESVESNTVPKKILESLPVLPENRSVCHKDDVSVFELLSVDSSANTSAPATLDLSEDQQQDDPSYALTATSDSIIGLHWNVSRGPVYPQPSLLPIHGPGSDLKLSLSQALHDSMIQSTSGAILPSNETLLDRLPKFGARESTAATDTSFPVYTHPSAALFSAMSTSDLPTFSIPPGSSSSRCRSAGASRTAATASSAAAPDGMAQA